MARAPGELLEILAADARRTVIVVPDLSSGSSAQFVRSLTRLPHLRLIIETRTGSAAHLALAGEGCAELDLDLEHWWDRQRYEAWRTTNHTASVARPAPSEISEQLDLADPASVCAADPWLITALYEGDSSNDHEGLRTAWLKAGHSLCRDQPPASRALVLLTTIGEGCDPRLLAALTALSGDAPWRVDWARMKGNVTPPWPGPVTAMTVGSGPLGGCVLTADQLGTVRALHAEDASARGRLRSPTTDISGMSVLSDGTVLILDGAGRIYADKTWTTLVHSNTRTSARGEPDETQALVKALHVYAGTALTSSPGPRRMIALGDASGTVRAFGDLPGTVALHEGRVTALAALDVPAASGTTAHMLYSGGADGAIRVWSPGQEPIPVPIEERTCPVVALHATWSAEGPILAVAWGDGLVQLHCPARDERLGFRPGVPVRAVTAMADRSLILGMDQAVVRLAAHSGVYKT